MHHAGEFDAAMAAAAAFDRRIIIEQGIPNAREIEVSILGNDQPEASVCGGLSPQASSTTTSRSTRTTDRGRHPRRPPAAACRSHPRRRRAGLSRAGLLRLRAGGLLLDAETLEPVIGEVNTIPGFTEISMFPQLLTASGVPARALMDRLIGLALERHRERQASARPTRRVRC